MGRIVTFTDHQGRFRVSLLYKTGHAHWMAYNLNLILNDSAYN